MAIRILVAGEIYIDQVMAGFETWPQPGEEVYASSLTREAGGGAPQTAAGLARLGRQVTLIGPIGKDNWIRSRLEEVGLRTDALYQHPSEPTGTTVAISLPSERSFFTYRGANQAIETVLQNLPAADHLHVAAAAGPELIRKLCTRAKTLSLDAGWHPEWLRSLAVQEALRGVTWFLPNEREAAALTGEVAPRAIAKRFDELGICAAIKFGSAGSVASAGGRYVEVPAIDVQAVETTGAGDCFDAGFLDAWLRSEPIEACLYAGNVCGALSTRKAGGINGFPSPEEMNAWRSKSR